MHEVTSLTLMTYCIYVSGYNYYARESVSIDIHAFYSKTHSTHIFFFSLKVTFVEFFFNCPKVKYDLKIIALCFLFTFTQHHLKKKKILLVFLFYSTLLQGNYCYLGSLILECRAEEDHHRKYLSV